MVRGRYVQQFGTDNEYVKALGMLEAAAATQKEKDDVNMIRGKYGLFEMTGGLTEGVAYDEKGTLVDDDVDVPEVADTSAEYEHSPDFVHQNDEYGHLLDSDERMKRIRVIAQKTGYPVDVVKHIVDTIAMKYEWGDPITGGFDTDLLYLPEHYKEQLIRKYGKPDADRQVDKSID